jgi:hypothetical protein
MNEYSQVKYQSLLMKLIIQTEAITVLSEFLKNATVLFNVLVSLSVYLANV